MFGIIRKFLIMKKATILFLTVVVFACNPLEKKIEGGWVVDQAYYHDEPVLWNLYGNGLGLNKDYTCNLPLVNEREVRTPEEVKGTWKVFEENGKTYLEINTENWIFSREFEVTNLRKVQDSVSFGYLMKMTLKADSLKMDCTKALYE